MNERCCSNEAVEHWDGVGDVQMSPTIADSLINRKNARTVAIDQDREPFFEGAGSYMVSPMSDTLDDFPYLAEGDHAEKDLWWGELRKPAHDLGLGAPAAPQLRDDVGVE